jgi:hypothetical protein
MYALLLIAIILLFIATKVKENFVFKVGNPFDDQEIVSFDPEAPGYKVFSITPDSCNGVKDELQDGLCYERCKSGFHGIGPVCWADTVNIGVGKPVGLEPCNPGWSNDGLTCREPIRSDKCAFKGLFGECWPGLKGGRIQGRLNGGGICDHPDKGNLPNWLVDKSDNNNWIATHPEKINGLCYTKCPPEKPNHVPGMPYLCMAGDQISYGRGVGEVPPIFHFGN